MEDFMMPAGFTADLDRGFVEHVSGKRFEIQNSRELAIRSTKGFVSILLARAPHIVARWSKEPIETFFRDLAFDAEDVGTAGGLLANMIDVRVWNITWSDVRPDFAEA